MEKKISKSDQSRNQDEGDEENEEDATDNSQSNTRSDDQDNTIDNQDNTNNSNNKRKSLPGVVFWIASRVLPCEVSDIERKYMQLFSSAGFSIFECKVCNKIYII